jgi:propanediol dehydratase small subunit
MKRKLTIADYPLAETRSAEMRGKRGKSLDEITLDAVMKCNIDMEDLRITPQALADQAEISRAAERTTLAANFDRAAELVNIPQDVIMNAYELLRPGRAKSKQQILELAQVFLHTYNAPRMAEFLNEATEVYERRGVFTRRY